MSEVLVYLDDVLVYSSSVEKHLQRLHRVSCKLEEFGLKVKGSKCSLFRGKVTYPGHVVSAEGITVFQDSGLYLREQRS